jgi:sarcosine oxidase subunit beta
VHARVAVVGGGVMGAAIALELARRLDPFEQPVLLFERRELGAGSSGRSGAILRCHYADEPVAAMARDSLRNYAAFEARSGRSIGFTRCGVITLAGAGPAHADSRARLERNAALLRSIGIDARLEGADGLRRLVPGIAVEEGALGLHEPDGGYVDPQATVEAFAALARDAGAITRVGCAVERLVLERGALVALETDEGRCTAEAVVLAAGPWTASLLARAGLRLPLELVRPEQHFQASPGGARARAQPAGPVDPARRQPGWGDELLALEPSAEAPAAHPVLIDLELGYYTRCEPRRARTRVGAIDHARDQRLVDPDALAEGVSADFSAWGERVLRARLPIYRELARSGAQAAWYTLSPDAQPLLGAMPGVRGLWVAAGFSGHGFKLAPAVGLGLAQLVLGEPLTAFDRAFFAPERFAAGASAARGGAFGL